MFPQIELRSPGSYFPNQTYERNLIFILRKKVLKLTSNTSSKTRAKHVVKLNVMLNQAIRKLDRRDPLHKSKKNKDRNLNLPTKKKVPQTLLQSSWCFTRNEEKHIVENKKKSKTHLQLQKSY